MGQALTVGHFYRAVDRIAPFATALSWDNVGLLVGSKDLPVSRAMLALDVTGPVIEEAERAGAQLLITHHPVVFEPLRQVEADSQVYRLIRRGLSVISAHTNLDMAPGGVNDALAHRLGLSGCRPLTVVSSRPYYKLAVGAPEEQAEAVYQAMAEAGAGSLDNYSHCAFVLHGEGRFRPMEGASPTIGSIGRVEKVRETLVEMLVAPRDRDAVLAAMLAAHPYEVPAYDLYENHGVRDQLCLGKVGELESALEPAAFAALVREKLNAPGVKYSAGAQPVRTVAVSSGAGGGDITGALRAGAQALVTGEVKHHQWLEAAEGGLTLVDAGHFATEIVVLDPLRESLRRELPGAELLVSRSGADGVRFA